MNRLAQSTSPYLLQHAHNPVDWHPWGEDALARARAENKPIFLSIGYAACHWCHVMAHESFEDSATAAFMNEHFINIKVDREERPDIDGIYMQAVIAMTGSGGWPMSVFLSHDLKPFYSGTYLPPIRRYNMPAFKDVLEGIANAWKNDRSEIEKVGEQVGRHLEHRTDNPGSHLLSNLDLNKIADSILASYDWGFGGWGDAPKFPQAMVLDFLLHHSILHRSEDSLKLIKHCLQAMSRGGMYDVIGGGFSRYSTDKFWRVPHFEKMLYDNALLTRTYLHAWQVTRDADFKRVVDETLEFITREMTHEQGGFYSSLDADSEGEEGAYYVWTLEEIRKVLGDQSELIEMAYAISPLGNWDGKTVLQRDLDNSSLAARFNLDPETVPAKIAESHARLFAARAPRVRPDTDDKILTAWNGLMLGAFAEAARVFENESYLRAASRCADFLLSESRPKNKLRRAWRRGKTTNEVFLEDYAALILGLIELYQAGFESKWFASARELADEMIELFTDPAGGFFDTPADAKQLLFRPKETQDNATPSGNSLACEALMKLAALAGDNKYREIAERALPLITDPALRYPLGFARWLSVAENVNGIIKQVAILGDAGNEMFRRMIRVIHGDYRPEVVVAASAIPFEDSAPALLRDRPLVDGKVTAYVCEGFVCRQPATDVDTLIAQLNK